MLLLSTLLPWRPREQARLDRAVVLRTSRSRHPVLEMEWEPMAAEKERLPEVTAQRPLVGHLESLAETPSILQALREN